MPQPRSAARPTLLEEAQQLKARIICKVCNHPLRGEIDEAFAAGIGAKTLRGLILNRDVEPLGASTLDRHKREGH